MENTEQKWLNDMRYRIRVHGERYFPEVKRFIFWCLIPTPYYGGFETYKEAKDELEKFKHRQIIRRIGDTIFDET